MKSLLRYEFLRFLLVGIFNTFTGLLIIYILKWFFDFSDISANFIGYSIGIFVSFALNSRWTFKYQGYQAVAFIKFLLISLIAYCINLLVVVISINYFEINSYISQAMGVPPYTIAAYLGSKYLIFRSKSDSNLNTL